MSSHEFALTDLTTLVALIRDGKSHTIIHNDPHMFIKSLLDDNGRGPGIVQIKGIDHSCMSVTAVLSLFCMDCMSSGAGTGGETSLWKDTESGEIYIVAWTYDDNDYYSTATSYLERVHPFF